MALTRRPTVVRNIAASLPNALKFIGPDFRMLMEGPQSPMKGLGDHPFAIGGELSSTGGKGENLNNPFFVPGAVK